MVGTTDWIKTAAKTRSRPGRTCSTWTTIAGKKPGISFMGKTISATLRTQPFGRHLRNRPGPPRTHDGHRPNQMAALSINNGLCPRPRSTTSLFPVHRTEPQLDPLRERRRGQITADRSNGNQLSLHHSWPKGLFPTVIPAAATIAGPVHPQRRRPATEFLRVPYIHGRTISPGSPGVITPWKFGRFFWKKSRPKNNEQTGFPKTEVSSFPSTPAPVH